MRKLREVVQNCMHCLAAQEWPPGATPEGWKFSFLRGRRRGPAREDTGLKYRGVERGNWMMTLMWI